MTSVSSFFFFFLTQHSLQWSCFLCWESCCCHRDGAEKKHLSLEAAEKQMNAKDYPPDPGDFLCLRLSIFMYFSTHFSSPTFFKKKPKRKVHQRSNNRYVHRIQKRPPTLSSRYKQQHVLEGIKNPDRC